LFHFTTKPGACTAFFVQHRGEIFGSGISAETVEVADGDLAAEEGILHGVCSRWQYRILLL
jgi:hypothetical protein